MCNLFWREKKASLQRERKALSEEYRRKITQIDEEIAEVEKTISMLEESLQVYMCRICKGRGTIRRLDAAGQTEDAVCSACDGTGVSASKLDSYPYQSLELDEG